MSIISVEATTNTNYIPLFQFDGDSYSLGIMHFEGTPGHFRYEWPLQWLSRDDMERLADAIVRLLKATEEE